MNLVVSLLTTTVGYDAVFTVVDKFSKLVKFKPCMTSTNAAKLVQLFMG